MYTENFFRSHLAEQGHFVASFIVEECQEVVPDFLIGVGHPVKLLRYLVGFLSPSVHLATEAKLNITCANTNNFPTLTRCLM